MIDFKLDNVKLGSSVLGQFENLCATSVFSVSPGWMFFCALFHHGDTENTEEAQRKLKMPRDLFFSCTRSIGKPLDYDSWRGP